jgi:hypothetical protein
MHCRSVHERNACRKKKVLIGEIAGSVERINNPQPFIAGFMVSALLGQKAVPGIRVADFLSEQAVNRRVIATGCIFRCMPQKTAA